MNYKNNLNSRKLNKILITQLTTNTQNKIQLTNKNIIDFQKK